MIRSSNAFWEQPRTRLRGGAGAANGLAASIGIGLLLVASACSPVEQPGDTASATIISAAPAEQSFLVIAHRGYSGRAPEHTWPAWDLAMEAGADYLEQDLQMTSDSVLVVLHDGTLDRTAGGPAATCTGPVGDRTLAQLQECEVGSWFNREYPELADSAWEQARIPVLADVLDRYASSERFYIETKDPESAPGMEEALVAELRRHPHLLEPANPPRVLVQSFSVESLRRVHALEPRLPLVMLFGRIPSQEIQDSIAGLAGWIAGAGPHYSSVDQALVDAAHAHGLVVHPYTVNTREEMIRLQDLGIDGMFTNEVELGMEVAEAE